MMTPEKEAEFLYDFLCDMGHFGLGEKYGIWGYDVRNLIEKINPQFLEFSCYKELVKQQEEDWNSQIENSRWRR